MGLDYFLCKMGLLKLYPLGCSDGQTLWILDTTLCMLRGNGGQNTVLPPLQSAPPSHNVSPSPAAPLLSHGWDCSRGGKEAPVPVWTRVPEYGHTFTLRPGSWGLPPPHPTVILSTLCCRLKEGLEGGLCVMEGVWLLLSVWASAGLAVRALVLPSFHSRLALFSFFPTFSFSSCLSCVFSQNSYGNRVFSCFLSLPLVCQISCFTNLL